MKIIKLIGWILVIALLCACALLFWLRSVQERLLRSRSKAWVVGAARMMLLYQLLRVFKYRFAVEPAVMRYAIYLYFVPMTLIPTLFLMTGLRIRRGNRAGRRDEALLLIPPGLLSLLTVTNDLHGLVYMPKVIVSEFAQRSYQHRRGSLQCLCQSAKRFHSKRRDCH